MTAGGEHSRITVLIVDDSEMIRRAGSMALAAEPQIEVIAKCPNGQLALAEIARIQPDIVILDVEMPVMNGLETLKAIKASYPAVQVLMFSAITQEGAQVTIEALNCGAADYVTKPQAAGADESLAMLREMLIPRIKWLARAPRTRLPNKAASPVLPSRRARLLPAKIVAIGSSTGGPIALTQVIPNLPADLPVPIVLVQHMPPVFTRSFATRLDASSPLTVVEAQAGMELAPGVVYLAPGDYHMMVQRAGTTMQIVLNQQEKENSCRPAVDPLFRSVAAAYGAGVCAVVMTGMGSDGRKGAEAVVRSGGSVLAQDEASSVVWGMPGAVVEAGLADHIIPLGSLAAAILKEVMRPPGEVKR